MGLIPDWEKMMAEAPALEGLEARGNLYIIADSHLGDRMAPTGEFFQMLESLPDPGTLIFLGDLFRVWLAMPKFWNRKTRKILRGFEALRQKNVRIVFVVGNREYFLPARQEQAERMGLPFDQIVHQACVLNWHSKKIGMSHGDTINRRDINHLRWQRFSRSRTMAIFFRLLPGKIASKLAEWIEFTLAGTNRAIKIQYPLDEIEAFGAAVLPGLDGFLVGHFHRDETLVIPGQKGFFRIVPDWHSRKALLRVEPSGTLTRLIYSKGQGLQKG